jgi:hypothetical protein
MHKWITGFSVIALVILFQNCEQNFVVDPGINTASSSSCSTKLANQTFQILALNKAIDCKDLNAIVCDNSVFSPDVDNGQSSSSICDVSNEAPGCVRLNSYFFNTMPAQKDNERTPAFAEGGSYNQTESRCSLLDTKGNALLIEAGDNLPDALKNLVHSCEEKKVSQ